MSTDFEKFFLKSKFLRKLQLHYVLFFTIIWTCNIILVIAIDNCNILCQHGRCLDNKCICDPGWQGNFCHLCGGRIRLVSNSGYITDGSGNYSEENKCAWLIDAHHKRNTTIRLHLDYFATECSWDHVYVFDGDSVYDPLVAVYRLNGCPSAVSGSNCSGKGVCVDGICTCNGGWGGPACSVPICPNNCSGNGHCNPESHKCICNKGFAGYGCEEITSHGWWEVYSDGLYSNDYFSLLGRASHTSAFINGILWVIGGKSFSNKDFLSYINVTAQTSMSLKSDVEPVHRFGHSAVVYNNSLYIYGGMSVDGNILHDLWEFNTLSLKWTEMSPARQGPSIVGIKSNWNNHSKQRNRRTSGQQSHHTDLTNNDLFSRSGSDHWTEKTLEKITVRQKDISEYVEQSFNENRCPHKSKPCMPVGSIGHAAVVIDSRMLVIFGHSHLYGDLNIVQEYDLETAEWKLLKTKGAAVSGLYGHTAIWEPASGLVFIHGGLFSFASSSTSHVVSTLLTFDPFRYIWNLGTPSPVPRYLHSAVLVPGLMLVFGGNTHNDTAMSFGSKCYSTDFVAYDLTCNHWHNMKSPPELYIDIARYGHTAAVTNNSMYIVGGFNGQMLSSVLKYNLGRILSRCEVTDSNDKSSFDVCPLVSDTHNHTSLCASQTSCRSCIHNTFGCIWCGSSCSYKQCPNSDMPEQEIPNHRNDLNEKDDIKDPVLGIASSDGCDDGMQWVCKSLHTCALCEIHSECQWKEKFCDAATNNSFHGTYLQHPEVPPETTASTDIGSLPVDEDVLVQQHCPTLCSSRVTCKECLSELKQCMWCHNEKRCVSNKTYLVNFPYGICREWTTEKKLCLDSHVREEHMAFPDARHLHCHNYLTCKDCQSDISCGWCDDGSGTGTGTCLEGGQQGPVSPLSGYRNLFKCLSSHWYFTKCPSCNCNGHSKCGNDTVCLQPCGNNTEGVNCQHCKAGFYGKPLNGGLCHSCECNGHGDLCERENGTCHCHTKGIIGDKCDRCDVKNNYYGEPKQGSCFYDLSIDYQFTFNLSKYEERHITQINFFSIPTKPDVDTDFEIKCSKEAKIKISAKITGQNERWISNITGTSFKQRFSAVEYVFGTPEKNTTFHVYVYNFTSPIEIVVSFSQHPKLDLIQFFSIFSLCFLVLLLVAAVLWKIKQKYDLYIRRQRQMVELEAMAARPFRPILLELEKSFVGSSNICISLRETQSSYSLHNGSVLGCRGISHSPESPKSKSLCSDCTQSALPETVKYCPSPIALEPCSGQKAAVLSLIVHLPTGGGQYYPQNHPGGLAVASTLVTLGSPRKYNIDTSFLKTDVAKTKSMNKITSSNGIDSCI